MHRPRIHHPLFMVVAVCLSGGLSAAPALAPPPLAPVRPVLDTYYGTVVVDPYRWMEAPNNPELDQWMKAQNDYTRALLASIPGRDALLKRIQAVDGGETRVFWVIPAGGDYFYMKLAPGGSIATLDVRQGLDGREQVLVDPKTLQQGDTHYSVNYFQPSYNGHYVAYGVSAGGSEESVLHVLNVRSGKLLDEAIDRVEGENDGFQPVAWRADGRSFFYYRQQKPRAGDPASAKYLKSRDYLHVLGKHADGDGDKPVFGYGVNANIKVAPDQDALVVTSPTSGYAFGVLTRNEEDDLVTGLYAAPVAELGVKPNPWRKISGEADQVSGFAVHAGVVYLLTHKDAPRYKIIATGIPHPDLAAAKVVVPESEAVVKGLFAAQDGLYVTLLDGGLGRAMRVPWGKGASLSLPLPYDGTIASLVADARTDGVLLETTSWTQPPLWYGFDPANNRVTDTKLQPPSPVDFSGIESREVKALSYDGTLVPLSIIMKKGSKLDGSHPTLLTGYGSYGLDIDPAFLPTLLPWLERGGIYAVAHVRGGGENGEAWHQAGMKLTKLNTVFDFIACGQYLVDNQYTSPAHLAGSGTSAGGITIGGAITWRPELFAAAVDNVGMTDTLRFETTPNGPPNVVEFGSVSTPDGFHALYAMSAYAHVRDGVAYPAVLLTTGAHDPRVSPWIVAKMAARLQAADAGGKPVLLRVDYDAGHGIGSTRAQRDAQLADSFAFLLWQLGDAEFQPGHASM